MCKFQITQLRPDTDDSTRSHQPHGLLKIAAGCAIMLVVTFTCFALRLVANYPSNLDVASAVTAMWLHN